MAYTPELDPQFSAILRRVAWAAGRPMTVVLREMVFLTVGVLDAEKVCAACRDKKACARCLRALKPTPASVALRKLVPDA